MKNIAKPSSKPKRSKAAAATRKKTKKLKKPLKKSSIILPLAAGLGIIFGAIVLFLYTGKTPAPDDGKVTSDEEAPAEIFAEQEPPVSEEPTPPAVGTIVIVIDDAGNNLSELEAFLSFPGKLSVAVLPGLPNSSRAAELVRNAGKELLLHQPMESIGGVDPGPGAIYNNMSGEEAAAVLRSNLDALGAVAGVNNHQGSLVTQNEKIMEALLELCRQYGIYFLDSRTTADTVLPRIAKKLNMRIAERNIFLDNIETETEIEKSLAAGIQILSRTKTTVMIGHAWSPLTAKVLNEKYIALCNDGYIFATPSALFPNEQDDRKG
jgi:polysaccharide deacetylase 2 family uncharacterized protein YibQ